jgi:hypothetical protein
MSFSVFHSGSEGPGELRENARVVLNVTIDENVPEELLLFGGGRGDGGSGRHGARAGAIGFACF